MYILETMYSSGYLGYPEGRRPQGIFWSHENVLYLDVGYVDVCVCQNLWNFIFNINICDYM